MHEIIVIKQAANSSGTWIASVISIATLVLNIVFYVFVAPKINLRESRREKFKNEVGRFLDFLSDILTLDEYDGVLSSIAKKSRKLKLFFKSGDLPEPLDAELEKIYQSVKRLKQMNDSNEIDKWREDFRLELKTIRKMFAKYTGVF